jgi:FkbM family methyltransferase
MMKKINPIAKSLSDVQNYVQALARFYKYHKLRYTLKRIIFFVFERIKRVTLNLQKENLVVVNGNRFVTIPRDEGISAELLMFRIHEPLTTQLLKKELQKGMVICDIGANIGYYALLECGKVGIEGRVIAIEASPLNFFYLTKNINLNRFDNIRAFNFALSDRDGNVLFLLYPKKSNWSQVVINRSRLIEKGINASSVIIVPAKTLDHLCMELSLKRLDFIRMDVEGYEFQVIKGGRMTIQKFKPTILMEVHVPLCGLENTIIMLDVLKRYGYDNKYFWSRANDHPFIGTEKSIQRLGIDQIIEGLKIGRLPYYFSLLLTSS